MNAHVRDAMLTLLQVICSIRHKPITEDGDLTDCTICELIGTNGCKVEMAQDGVHNVLRACTFEHEGLSNIIAEIARIYESQGVDTSKQISCCDFSRSDKLIDQLEREVSG